MNRFSLVVAIASLWSAAVGLASPADALRIQKSWKLTMEIWNLESKTATTPAAQAKIWNSRPDPIPVAREMWNVISPSLGEEWIIEPAAWFLRITPNLTESKPNESAKPAFTKEVEAIRKAIETKHLKSKKLLPICMALASTQDPRSLAVLEKIITTSPDEKIQGVAALAAAIVLKSIGDDAEMMRKRLTYLRKAIIQSSEVELDGTTVAKLAENELYIIRFLTKGRTAPDLIGVDSGNLPLKLSDIKNKIVVLIFWNSTMHEAERVVQITNEMIVKFKNRPLLVLGVNNDVVAQLRDLEGNGVVNWKSLSDPTNKLGDDYRVGAWPLVYLLDAERKIHYAGPPGSFVELTAEALIAEMKPAAVE
ncbi:MAG: redoxin domain-containing protein [Gloeobacteraceae cyanobacterium ES-bin-144]|nr:redoxin domain-containing protein [Verrucomicrobiales bacterium]